MAWLEDEQGRIPDTMILMRLDGANTTLANQWRELTETRLPECHGVELPHHNEAHGSASKLPTAAHYRDDDGVTAAILERHMARDFDSPRLNFVRLADQPERPHVAAPGWFARLQAAAMSQQRDSEVAL